MTILKVNNVSKNYGGLSVITDVTFEVKKGEIMGLIGPNGAGKTTIMNLISQLTPISKGTITLNDSLLNGKPPHEIAKMGISRTFQVVKPFGGLTVLENVMIGAFYGKRAAKTHNEAKDTAMEALKITGLESEKNRDPRVLPLAKRKKLETARALATQPDVLLLDEVMAGLGSRELEDMMGELLKLKEKGITILAIEHVIKAIMKISDRIVVLHLGQKIFDGSPKEVIKDKAVIEAYLGHRFAHKE